MSLSGNNSNTSQNLENSNMTQNDIDSLNQTLTGITYDIPSDTTTIGNNLIIQSGKTLYVNGQDVEIRLDTIDTILTGIEYVSGDVTTLINNILVIDNILSIPSYPNVKNTLTSLSTSVSANNTSLTGITYLNSSGQDLTTIDNNLTISTGKILNIEGYSNVKTTLDNLTVMNEALTDISYSSDITTINNSLTLTAGKILNIDGYSNVKTTLDTINTSLTGITYSSTYPLFIPKTLINQNLEIASNKKIICDEIWSKYFSTHDFTDLIGVGYFKTWFYNNGSIGYISTVDPLYEDASTGTEIRVKIGTNNYNFTNDGLSLNWKILNLVGDIELPTYPSLTTTLTSLTNSINTINTTLTDISFSTDTTTINNNLTLSTGKVLAIPNYTNVESTLTSLTSNISTLQIMTFEDDFIDGFVSNPMPWTSIGSGSVAQISCEPYYTGIIRMDGDSDRTLFPTNTLNAFFWDSFIRMDVCFRTRTTTNLNVTYTIGMSTASSGPADTFFWSYNNASSGQWEMKVNNINVQTAPTLPITVGSTGEWWFASFVKQSGTKILRYYLKNLTTGDVRDWTPSSALTNISTTAEYLPYFRVTRTDGVTGKTLDIDYVKIQYATGRPYTV